jgi:hypothetical protein
MALRSKRESPDSKDQDFHLFRQLRGNEIQESINVSFEDVPMATVGEV